MIKHLEPSELFGYFNEICQIPRPSKKEEKIIAYLQAFGAKHNLETITDKAGNILIRKSASKGMESKPIVILQSHMDMVCEKNNDTKHNFDTDPIQCYVDGEWIKAKGTTLGADNGIGMAAALAILANKTITHPSLECLFTVDEETGLTGAFALEKNVLKGSVLINLDSEDDGELFIGCAGGKDSVATFSSQEEKADEKYFFFKLSVKGLKGGHSGDDIDKGLANANKILSRFLWETLQATELRLCSIDGGNLRNAIAREAFVIGAVPDHYKEPLRISLNHFIHNIENEYSFTEPDLQITLESEEKQSSFIDTITVRNLIYALQACPHGIIRMSDNMKGLVETSTNLASIKCKENKIIVSTSQRSSIESAKLDIVNTVESVFILAGASVTHGDGYPGWNPNPDSEIVKITANAHKRLFGKEPKVRAIHAGLECGLFLEKYPHLDMVSFGPTMRGVHSPNEKLHIEATLRFWKLLLEVLKSI